MTESIKPSLHFTLICDDIRQELGGKVSIMGLFENIFAQKFPAVHPRMAVVTEWGDGKGDYEVRTRLLSPDRSSVLRETSSKIKLPNVNAKHRDVSVHLNLEFKKAGTYWIENYLGDELVSSMPLNVVQVKEQAVH
jgi:hypothetical protein